MSALLPKADIDERDCHVRFVPETDMRLLVVGAAHGLLRRLAMTHRCRWYRLRRRGRAISLAVKLPYIACHFQTGDQLRITRLAAHRCFCNAMRLIV